MRLCIRTSLAALSMAALTGCPGTISVTQGDGVGAIAEALRVISVQGEFTTETVVVSSRTGGCDRMQEIADGYAALQDLTIDEPDWESASSLERYCEEQVAYGEERARIDSLQYAANHWSGSFSFFTADAGQMLSVGTYVAGGASKGQGSFSGTIVEVDSNPYAAYTSISFDCAAWATETTSNDRVIYEPPTSPRFQDIYASYRYRSVSEGEAELSEEGGTWSLAITDGVLVEDGARKAGEFTMDATLTDCELDIPESPIFAE